MPTVHQRVRGLLRTGQLTDASPLQDVPKIGRFLAAGLQRGVPANTIGEFRRVMAGLTDAAAFRVLSRSLQNQRRNQCVRSSRRQGQEGVRPRGEYHTGDINQHGYEAVRALLGTRPGLPLRLPARAQASKECGCRAVCDGPCRRTDDGACVPRAANARGFVGVVPHNNQSVAVAAYVPGRSRTRVTQAMRNDPVSAQDIAAGHRKNLRYSRRGSRMWRTPRPQVRLPLR